MIIGINSEIIEYSKKIQNLCKKPFYGNPKGCTNYNYKKTCPPNQPLIDKVLDLDNDICVIYIRFNIEKFVKYIREKHPELTERQVYNSRYWQPRARKELGAEEQEAIENLGLIKIVRCPEAHGVNVDDLMKKIGIELNWDWPAEHKYLVSLGSRINDAKVISCFFDRFLRRL